MVQMIYSFYFTCQWCPNKDATKIKRRKHDFSETGSAGNLNCTPKRRIITQLKIGILGLNTRATGDESLYFYFESWLWPMAAILPIKRGKKHGIRARPRYNCLILTS